MSSSDDHLAFSFGIGAGGAALAASDRRIIAPGKVDF